MSAQFDTLQLLQPIVQKFVMAFLDVHPGGQIASGRRCIDDQARADAQNVVADRTFIQRVYVPSKVKDAMAAICQAYPAADVAELQTRFAACLGGFSDDDLRHFSLHLSGYAVDLTPTGNAEAEAWCEAYVEQLLQHELGDPAHCRVLTREAGLVRLHVQLVPAV